MTTTPTPPDHDTPDQPLIDALWQQLRYPPERTYPATDDFTTAVCVALDNHRAAGHALFTSVVHQCCADLADAAERARVLEEILERSETGHVTFTRRDGSEMHPDWCRECRVDAARVDAGLPTDPEAVARQFHETYERLAPAHGYATREASAKPWEQVPEQNRGLMIAVAAELLADWQQAEWRQAFVPIPPQPAAPTQVSEYHVGDRVQVVDAEGTVLPAAGRVRIQLDAGPVIEVERPFVQRLQLPQEAR